MATAEAATPAPTYGTPAVSSAPCTVPSSPWGPWSTGKATSRPRGGTSPASDTSWARPSGPGTIATGRPSTLQTPSAEMTTGTTSKRSGSSAAITAAADASETSCSLLRPPIRTATRVLTAWSGSAAGPARPTWWWAWRRTRC